MEMWLVLVMMVMWSQQEAEDLTSWEGKAEAVRLFQKQEYNVLENLKRI